MFLASIVLTSADLHVFGGANSAICLHSSLLQSLLKGSHRQNQLSFPVHRQQHTRVTNLEQLCETQKSSALHPLKRFPDLHTAKGPELYSLMQQRNRFTIYGQHIQTI